jgi:hypothetical protein
MSVSCFATPQIDKCTEWKVFAKTLGIITNSIITVGCLQNERFEIRRCFFVLKRRGFNLQSSNAWKSIAKNKSKNILRMLQRCTIFIPVSKGNRGNKKRRR